MEIFFCKKKILPGPLLLEQSMEQMRIAFNLGQAYKIKNITFVKILLDIDGGEFGKIRKGG